jgi:hypothetical protein
MTSCKQTVFTFKNMLVEYVTLAAMLNLCAPEENHLIKIKQFSFLMRKILTRMERQTARITDRCVLTCPRLAQPGLAEGQPDDHWLKEMWPPSSTDCIPLDYFMWCINALILTWPLVVIHACKKFQSSAN